MHPNREACSGAEAVFTGTLITDAHAALEHIDSTGDAVPVIVLDVESDRGMHMPARFKQRFPVGRMDQAEAAARHYRKGQRVEVQTSALSIRLSAVATHIHTIKNEETSQCPASPSSP